jgi:hypothetical protein
MLSRTIAFQGFQSIAGRHTKIVQFSGNLELPQLAARDCRDVHEPLNPLALRKSCRVWARKGPDHG